MWSNRNSIENLLNGYQFVCTCFSSDFSWVHTIHYRDRLQKGQEVRLATLQVTANGKRHRVTMDLVSNTKTIKKNMESRNIKHVNLIALWNRKTVKNEAFCNKWNITMSRDHMMMRFITKSFHLKEFIWFLISN